MEQIKKFIFPLLPSINLQFEIFRLLDMKEA
jgi:hypothetical protein